jgi:hypothetical protein
MYNMHQQVEHVLQVASQPSGRGIYMYMYNCVIYIYCMYNTHQQVEHVLQVAPLRHQGLEAGAQGEPGRLALLHLFLIMCVCVCVCVNLPQQRL